MREPGRGLVIGVDTGGTFTDVVAVDPDGRVVTEKALSTPHRPADGVLAALDNLARAMGTDRRDLLRRTARFAHGTTVSTNALLQRRGARVGLLLTAGFEDTLVIGRGPMGRTGGLPYEKAMDFAHAETPVPLVPRDFVRGAEERLDKDGKVLLALSERQVRRAVSDLVDRGIQSLAVCLLWSFRNPAHEHRVREVALEVAPHLPVSLSCEVAPVLGEYERAMTTVVNAYVGPISSRYLADLESDLRAEGLAQPVQVMTSSGGSCLVDQARDRAVAIINSGPVGGLVAARALGQQIGEGNLITTDMGGTSFDAGVIFRGEYDSERTVFLDPGIPVQVPAAKVVAVGAGGGSIARSDGRRLFVGPQSAGSDPGPACYGRGGTEPTVTDALAVLGILDPEYFFGGRVTLDREAARDAIRTRVAEPLGLSVEQAAAGIYEIVNARMADLVRKVTVESGLDPRQFTLVAYGGSGPAHCAYYGAALGVQEIVVPPTSPVFSALGVALADVVYSHARSDPLAVSGSESMVRTFNHTFEGLEERALADVRSSGGAVSDARLIRHLDVRYSGQMNEVTIPWSPGRLTEEDVPKIRAAFDAVYATRFGHNVAHEKAALEIITFRVDAVLPTAKPAGEPRPDGDARGPAPLRGTRPVYVRGEGAVETTIYRSGDLLPGHNLGGPCIVERPDTTVYLPRGFTACVDGHWNLRLRTEAKHASR